MGYKYDLGQHGELLMIQILRKNGWHAENLNQSCHRNFEWGDLYAVSPGGTRILFSVKARNAVERQSRTRLVWNGCYDGKGEPEFKTALNNLRLCGRDFDTVGWIAMPMRVDQTFDAYAGSLSQMVLTGEKEDWSIPMRPVDRATYVHVARGRHNFDWLRYREERDRHGEPLWFCEAHEQWKRTGKSPQIHESQPRARTRPPLGNTPFGHYTREPYAHWSARATFGPAIPWTHDLA